MTKPSIMTDDDFRAAYKAGSAPSDATLRKGFIAEIKAAADAERTLDFTISTASVDRMGDTIAADGWRLDNYKRNPVVLWAHDSNAHPIAKASQIRIENGALKARAEFVPMSVPVVGPIAEATLQLLKGGFLSATSVGFAPINYKWAEEDGREFGIDFTEQELLEFSIVPVPANPEALVEARAAGVDVEPVRAWAIKTLGSLGFAAIAMGDLETLRRSATAPQRIVKEFRRLAKTVTVKGTRNHILRLANIAEREFKASDAWKSGASRDLPIDNKDTWDGGAAEKRMLDAAGFDGDNPDVEQARRGFLAYDSANPTLRGSYKLPFADMIDGRLQAVAGGIRAAASRLPQTDIPDSVKEEARGVIDHYQARMDNKAAAPAMPCDNCSDPEACMAAGECADAMKKSAPVADPFAENAARRLAVLRAKAPR